MHHLKVGDAEYIQLVNKYIDLMEAWVTKNFDDNFLAQVMSCTRSKNAFIHLPLPDLTPRSAHLGFHLLQDSLVNHIHLIFKIAVYNQRSAGFCSLNYKSKLKMGLPVFARGQKIKVKFPKQNVRFGTVTATRDN